MNYDEFNQFCQALPATTHVVQWGGSQVWKVGGKVFAIGGWAKASGPAFTFKTSERNFAFLSEHEGYRPAPYFASRGMKWIQQTDTAGGRDEELRYYLAESYRLVVQGLTKKGTAAAGCSSSARTAIMKHIYTHENIVVLHSVKNVLALNDIASVVKNEHTIPAGPRHGINNIFHELWILDDQDFDRAVAVIDAEIDNPVAKAPWQCSHCQEENEGSFEICWKCQREPASA